jgi:hypothetical protein
MVIPITGYFSFWISEKSFFVPNFYQIDIIRFVFKGYY